MEKCTGSTTVDIDMTSNLKHIYFSDAPNPKDHIISAHVVDALTSVSGVTVVRSSRNQTNIHEIQSDVVDLLEPHLILAPKNPFWFFQVSAVCLLPSFARLTRWPCPTDNQGLLKPNDTLPKNPGRYTAVAPALPVSESLAASFPAAFLPHNLQTIFSPSKHDVDITKNQ